MYSYRASIVFNMQGLHFAQRLASGLAAFLPATRHIIDNTARINTNIILIRKIPNTQHSRQYCPTLPAPTCRVGAAATDDIDSAKMTRATGFMTLTALCSYTISQTSPARNYSHTALSPQSTCLNSHTPISHHYLHT